MRVYAENNAHSTLVGDLTDSSGDTSVEVASSAGFPQAPFVITINTEYMLVTEVNGSIFTVERGYEGSSITSHSDGDTVQNRWTAKSFNDLWDEVEDKAEQSNLDDHSVQHEDGGSDEINVGGLSGELADPQTPKTHSGTHEDGGTDEINLEDLDGESAELKSHKADNTPHATAQELTASNEISVTNTDDATSPTAAPLKTAGGIGVAKSAYVGEKVIIQEPNHDGSEAKIVFEIKEN